MIILTFLKDFRPHNQLLDARIIETFQGGKTSTRQRGKTTANPNLEDK